MIDTFSRSKSCKKKYVFGDYYYYFLRCTNDPCNSRNFNFSQLSANRQPALCFRPQSPGLPTNNLVRYKTHFDPSEGFVTVSRITTKTFSVTFQAVINIKTKILNDPSTIRVYRIISKSNVVKYGVME